nr:integrase, catalytic region, zinc finger, CCHC-type, peptidase aspartic, catalytic [Tanacetum cinerariifolium]
MKPTLYDGIVIFEKHVAMPVIDNEETLILKEVSRSKILTDDFGKRFTPQQELSAEQALWLRISNPTIESFLPLVRVEVPSELPKVSLVNESHKKLKFQLAQFEFVVKNRTTPNALTEGVKCSTSASRSKPSSNTKNNRASQPSSSNKINKVENQTRSVKTRKNNKNRVKKVKCDDHVIFENDQIARIMGYGDYQLGNVVISRVYYVEGLGHNLFSVGQFCDADLEVAFRKNTCFIRDLESVDLILGSRDTDLYTISLDDMLKSSLIFRNVRTYNGTKFVNQTLREFYENVGISHQTFAARTPQQNGVVEGKIELLLRSLEP